MQFAPDGNSLALMVMPARGKQALQLFDATTWKITRGVDRTDVIRLLGHPIHLMDHLPDGRFLAACADNSVLLLDIQTARFEILGRHPTRGVPGYFGTGTAIMAQTLSHDGRFLATGGHENLPTIRVWNLTTKRPVLVLVPRDVESSWVGRCFRRRLVQEFRQVAVSGVFLIQFALRGFSRSLFCLPQLEVRAVSQAIFFAGAGFYDDCGSGQQLLCLDVDAIAAGLAQAATGAPLGPNRGGEEAAVFHRPELLTYG